MEWINAFYQLFAFAIMIGIFTGVILFIRSQIRRTKQLERMEQEIYLLRKAQNEDKTAPEK
ncbi:hypothetical protein [Alkalicoccus daliensis]|uniref:DUF4083 domain-containing protein n=1 Tax=Alkalicoccus daliensis TaxID=745820 RepID=A0A1H0GTR9_9BACI|nr:hypothetical protein [Alkalicoccus daliensis]SDO10265.1 hypothetical protein SAMN04488053_10728 [Alkalicoccus daliensis]